MRGSIGVRVHLMTGAFAGGLGMTEARKPSRTSGPRFVRRFLGILALVLLMSAFAAAGTDEKSDKSAVARVREELWAIPSAPRCWRT